MASILVVCTGNVCRSPIAEGMLRFALEARLAEGAPDVASAGTMGWTGSGADPSSIRAAAEHGVDISAHRARELSETDIARATLILGMAEEHTRAVVGRVPEAEGRTFTLKEAVHLLEELPQRATQAPELQLEARVGAAERLRRRGPTDASDDDIADPLGRPFEAFRTVASELDEWCSRLVEGLFGRAGAPAAKAAESD